MLTWTQGFYFLHKIGEDRCLFRMVSQSFFSLKNSILFTKCFMFPANTTPLPILLDCLSSSRSFFHLAPNSKSENHHNFFTQIDFIFFHFQCRIFSKNICSTIISLGPFLFQKCFLSLSFLICFSFCSCCWILLCKYFLFFHIQLYRFAKPFRHEEGATQGHFFYRNRAGWNSKFYFPD